MAIKGLKSYANVRCYLTANATDTNLKVSVADAVILSNYISNFTASGCRLMVGNYAEYNNQNYGYETFLVAGVNVATGIITTLDSLSGEADYTTAKNSYVAVNLVYDGNCDGYGAGGWTVSGESPSCFVKTHADNIVGAQSFHMISHASGESQEVQYPNVYNTKIDENYLVSLWYKGESGGDSSFRMVDTIISEDLVVPTELVDDGEWHYKDITIKVSDDWEFVEMKVSENPGINDSFGELSLDGDWLLVSVYGYGVSAGAIEIYKRSGHNWNFTERVQASDITNNDRFGINSAISGDTFIAGADKWDGAFSNQGAIYVFTRSGENWVEKQILNHSDPEEDDYWGLSGNSINGETIACGISYKGTIGAVYVFTISGGSWVQQQKLEASDGITSDRFGISVNLKGDYIAVGASSNDNAQGTDAGSVYIFTRSGETWTEQQRLDYGSVLNNGRFGSCVYLHTDEELYVGSRSGGVSIYTRSGETWSFDTRVGDTVGESPGHGYYSMSAIHKYGDQLFISDYIGDTIYIYRLMDGLWILKSSFYGPGYGGSEGSFWGMTPVVTSSGQDMWLIAGGIYDDKAGYHDAGALQIYHYHDLRGGEEKSKVDFRLIQDTGFKYLMANNLCWTQLVNDDPGFEISSVMNDWSSQGSPLAISDSSNERSGSRCLKITSSDDSNYKYRDYTTVSGNWYMFKVYGYGDSGTTACVLSNATTKLLTTTSDSYDLLSCSFKAESSTLRVGLYNGDDICYFDDLSIVPLRVVDDIDTSVSSAANSYNRGRWGTAQFSFRVDGTDVLYWTTSNRVSSEVGSLGCNVLLLPFDSYAEDKYIWSVEDVFKLYYDYDDYRFKFEIYNGSSWKVASGPVMSHTISGWYHVCVNWNNQTGTQLYLNTISGFGYSGSWAAQALPTNMYFGCRYDGTLQFDMPVDDGVIYKNELTQALITDLFS